MRVEMRRLGRSQQELSVLGYGAWVTGADTASRTIDVDSLSRAIEVALDAGITWVDTAEIYAGGLSEEIVGRALRPVRDDVFVSTKVAPAGAGSGMRPGDIARAIRQSLGRLGTDHVDLYQLHWHGPAVPLEDTWGAMRELVEGGLVRFAGVSNFDRGLIERCLAAGPVDSVQNQLSLLHRDDEAGLLHWLKAEGIGYLAYGPLAFGLLSGGVTTSTTFGRRDWRSGGPARYETNYYKELYSPGRRERHLAFVGDLARLTEELELPLPVLALRWVLDRPGVTAVVGGSLNPEHVRTNALAGRARIETSARARIDELLALHYGVVAARSETTEGVTEWPSQSGSIPG